MPREAGFQSEPAHQGGPRGAERDAHAASRRLPADRTISSAARFAQAISNTTAPAGTAPALVWRTAPSSNPRLAAIAQQQRIAVAEGKAQLLFYAAADQIDAHPCPLRGDPRLQPRDQLRPAIGIARIIAVET